MQENNRKILVIDSEGEAGNFIEVNLTKFGYNVTHAKTTEQGLQLANENPPSIIICDQYCKRIDGIEFCWVVRETPKLRSIPLIVLTLSTDQETYINGYRNGADAFVLKPISLRVLLTRIESLIWRAERIREDAVAISKPSMNGQSQSALVSSLQGSLESFSLIELIQFLNTSQKTGTLHLQNNGSSGKIVLQNGEILYGRADSIGGEEAFYELSKWRDGQFEFSEQIASEDQNVKTNTMKLILDFCASQDVEDG